MQIKVSAPGNLFFLGEHAVVYNRPSINTAVNRRCYVIASKRADDKIFINSDLIGKAQAEISKQGLVNINLEKKELEPILDELNYIIKKFDIKQGFEIKIESKIPIKSGLSSSTAVLTSILKAVTQLFSCKVKLNEYWNNLYQFQVKIHGGKASGSEIISSALGGYNLIQKIESEKEAKIKWEHLGEHKFSVVISDTRVMASTALTVGYHVPSLIKRNPKLVWQTFDQIAKLVEKAKEAIINEDIETLGKLMNENQKLLEKLKLSHPKLDDCIEEALNAGALGAKLSGGGWGGVMFALTYPEDQNKVAKAIAETGANVIKTEVGVEGVEVKR